MDPALQTLLTETVSIQPYTGMDQYGKPSYGPAVTYPARVAYRVTTLTNAQGQERTSTTTVYLDGAVTITVKDRLMFADGTAPAIQDIYSPTDPTQPGTGPDHHEVLAVITITLDGMTQVTQQLQRLMTAPLPATGEALYAEGNSIMGQSVQLVPVDTGNLAFNLSRGQACHYGATGRGRTELWKARRCRVRGGRPLEH